MKPLLLIRSCALLLLSVIMLGHTIELEAKQRRPAATAAFTIVNPEYKRVTLDSGGWEPETYSFVKGTLLDGSGSDDSLTELPFIDMCRLLAVALEYEDYIPTPAFEETDLFIVVSWGKTIPHDSGLGAGNIDGMGQVMSRMSSLDGGPDASPEDRSELSSLESEMDMMLSLQHMNDRARARANNYNARLLGYAPTISTFRDALPASPLESVYKDLVQEIETSRYFVILQAFDFRKLRAERKTELMWMTRFSIRAKGRDFDKELAAMASAAASTFGKETRRIKRHLRPGKAEMGDIEVISTGEDVETTEE